MKVVSRSSAAVPVTGTFPSLLTKARQARGIAITILIVALLFSFGSPLPTGAQGPVNVTIDDLNIDSYPDMKVLVTARDANGVPIPDLAPTALS